METAYQYSAIWARYDKRSPEAQKTIAMQFITRLLNGCALEQVSEIVMGSPDWFKKASWEKWAAQADVSGYHFKEILALATDNPMEVIYPIIQRWVKTAKLAKYSAKDIQKIGQYIAPHEDYAILWRNWANTADLRKYHVMEVAELMYMTTDEEAATTLGLHWFEQCGDRAKWELGAMGNKEVMKISGYHLPNKAISVWAKARDEELAKKQKK